MKPLSLNIKHMKKVKETNDIATFKHPEGHTITVAKAKLSPEMRKSLSALPTFDEGGAVEAPTSDVPGSGNKDNPRSKAQDSMRKAFGSDQKNVNPPASPKTYAEGGAIEKQSNPKLEESKKQPPKPHFADGGGPDPLADSTAAPQAMQDSAEQIQSDAQAGATQLSPLIQAQRTVYNDLRAKSDPKGMVEGALFGPNGEEPAAFDPNIWRQAVAQQDLQTKSNMAGQAEAAQRAAIDNQARVEAGLAPATSIPTGNNAQQQPTRAIGAAPEAEQSPSAGTQGSEGQYGEQYFKGLNQRIGGEQELANAISQQSKEVQPAIASQINQEQANNAKTQQQMDNAEVEYHNFVSDVQNGHIDVDRYMNNMSTPKHIATAVGLILGGMGGGLTGQENPVLKSLNQRIEQDIQGQVADLGRKRSLVEANLQHFRNIKDASDMARAQLNALTSHRMEYAAAKSGDPAAQARAKIAIGNLNMDSQQRIDAINMRQALMKASQQGGASGDASGAMLPYLRAVNPAAAKEIEARKVPGVGDAQIPVPEKAREELQSRQSLHEQVQNLRNWSSKHSGDLSPTDVAYGKALANNVMDQYRRANGQGVFREAESKFVGSMLSDNPTAFLNKFRADPGYKAVEDSNQMALNGLKKAYGLPQSSGLTPAQQSFAHHAQQVLQRDPNDAKALMVLKKLGLK